MSWSEMHYAVGGADKQSKQASLLIEIPSTDATDPSTQSILNNSLVLDIYVTIVIMRWH